MVLFLGTPHFNQSSLDDLVVDNPSMEEANLRVSQYKKLTNLAHSKETHHVVEFTKSYRMHVLVLKIIALNSSYRTKHVYAFSRSLSY